MWLLMLPHFAPKKILVGLEREDHAERVYHDEEDGHADAEHHLVVAPVFGRYEMEHARYHEAEHGDEQHGRVHAPDVRGELLLLVLEASEEEAEAEHEETIAYYGACYGSL